MRYLVFIACFSFAFFSHALWKRSSEPLTPVSYVSQSIEFPAEKDRRSLPADDYMKWAADSINYNDYTITNAVKGIEIKRKGRRILFIKNEHSEKQIGRFALRSLLGDEDRQLIYETRTGGNHCCVYHTVLDLSGSKPEVIFRSQDFGVQGGYEDHLGLFDRNGDGRLEITQTQTYYVRGGPAASHPVIEVGFEFDEKLNRYRPIGDFLPSQREKLAELENEISGWNRQIRSNIQPDFFPSYYESQMAAIALTYAYANKSQDGLDFIRDNYLFWDYKKRQGPDLRSSAVFSRRLRSDIKRFLLEDKVFSQLQRN